MVYIPEVHKQKSKEYVVYLKGLRDHAKQLRLVLCGQESEAHVWACNNLVGWAKDCVHLQALYYKIAEEILEREREKARDSRQIENETLVSFMNSYHDTYIGVYLIALKELDRHYEELVKVAQQEYRRMQRAFAEKA